MLDHMYDIDAVVVAFPIGHNQVHVNIHIVTSGLITEAGLLQYRLSVQSPSTIEISWNLIYR